MICCVISVDVCFSSNECHALFSHRKPIAVQARCFVLLRLIGDVRSVGTRDPSLALRMTRGGLWMTEGEVRMTTGVRMTL